MSYLRPAVLYKDMIEWEFKARYFTTDMSYISYMDNWYPDILDCPGDSTYQYAIVDNEDRLIGYAQFKVDWYPRIAYDFLIVSFDKGNLFIGAALKEISHIIQDWKLHRIEWSMVEGNPVQRTYDRLIKKYNGNYVVRHDAIKDRYGNYLNMLLYEIIFDDGEKRSKNI